MEKENPLLYKAEFYFKKCQGLYNGKNHFPQQLHTIYTLMLKMVPVLLLL